MTTWVEAYLAKRKPRTLTDEEKECVAEHVEGCLQCLKFETRNVGRHCDAYILFTTDSEAYAYYEKKDGKTDQQAAKQWRGGDVAAWKRDLAQQRAENPNLHRRFWTHVEWFRSQVSPENNYGYGNTCTIRVQFAVSTTQVVLCDGIKETLIYHQYADCE